MLRRAGSYFVIGYGGTLQVPVIDIISTEINFVGTWSHLHYLVNSCPGRPRAGQAAHGNIPARRLQRMPGRPRPGTVRGGASSSRLSHKSLQRGMHDRIETPTQVPRPVSRRGGRRRRANSCWPAGAKSNAAGAPGLHGRFGGPRLDVLGYVPASARAGALRSLCWRRHWLLVSPSGHRLGQSVGPALRISQDFGSATQLAPWPPAQWFASQGGVVHSVAAFLITWL